MSSAPVADNQPTKTCHQFDEKGTCTYGSKCKFSHIRSGDPSGERVNSNKKSRQPKTPKQSQNHRTHVKAFFDSYPEFRYKKSQPVITQFKALKRKYREDWSKDDAKQAHEAFKDALTMDFNDIYGTDENDLASWQKLCTVLNLGVPDDLESCRKRVKSTYVNLVDLVEAPYTGQPVEDFKGEAKLSAYTKETGKYFPRDNVHAGDLLRYLLRHIIVPGKSKKHSRRQKAKKGPGQGVKTSK